jgi:hypothetical protein
MAPDVVVLLAVMMLIGFALGYGARSFISYRRHQRHMFEPMARLPTAEVTRGGRSPNDSNRTVEPLVRPHSTTAAHDRNARGRDGRLR